MIGNVVNCLLGKEWILASQDGWPEYAPPLICSVVRNISGRTIVTAISVFTHKEPYGVDRLNSIERVPDLRFPRV